MMEVWEWTDDELIQVYGLQKRYADEVIDFVRHGDEAEVYKFLQMIPELHEYEKIEAMIFTKEDFVKEFQVEEVPVGKYIYEDQIGRWQGTDTLRDVFEDKYQWEFAEAHPETLAVFAGNKKLSLQKYSAEQYEKFQSEMPPSLMVNVKNLIDEYPKEIALKSMATKVYGYTGAISNLALRRYGNEHMPEFEKLQFLVGQQSADTIVDAYDLQAGLKIYQPELKDESLTRAIKNFVFDEKDFGITYGEKSAEILKQANRKVIELASRYDFVNTNEKLPVLENHKICLFDTEEQKIRILSNNLQVCLADKDFNKIMEAVATKPEGEEFSKRYYPNRDGSQEYSNQTYKVVGRCQSYAGIEPQWNIMFDDGKVVKASADEIISSAINERLFGEQCKNFGTRSLSEVSITDSAKKLNLEDAKARISNIIKQLQKNGEKTSKLQKMLTDESRNLSAANAR